MQVLPLSYIEKLFGLDSNYIGGAFIYIRYPFTKLPEKQSIKGFLKDIDRLVEGDDMVPSVKDRVKERLDDVLKM